MGGDWRPLAAAAAPSPAARMLAPSSLAASSTTGAKLLLDHSESCKALDELLGDPRWLPPSRRL